MRDSIRSIASRLEGTFPASERLSLCFGGQRIDVVSNSRALIDDLRGYFRAFDEADSRPPPDLIVRAYQTTPPDLGLSYTEWRREPGKQTRKEAYFDLEDGRVVHKVRTGTQFLVGRDLRVAVGDCLTHLNQIVNFINFQYTSYLMNQQLVLCHAAGVTLEGRGLGLAGFSGAGKSTLALHLMSAGWSFTSNDRLLVGPGEDAVEMKGIPKHPRINPGTALANPDLAGIVSDERRLELERLPRGELWELEEKYDAFIEQIFGVDRIELRAPIHAFLILAWSHRSSEPARFDPIDLHARPDLLETIMKSPGPFHQPNVGQAPTGYIPPDPEPYMKALAGLPIYEARGGADFEAGVVFCRELLSGDE